jgi:hypothetical protein
VKRSNSKARNSKPTKAKTGTAVKKPIILSDESDAEPPLPKVAQKKSKGPDHDVDTRPGKKTAKGKGKAIVETDAEDEGEPEGLAKGKGKGVAKDEAGDGAALPAKKSLPRKAQPAVDVIDPPPPKGRTKGKAKPSEDLEHDEAAKRKPDGSRKGKVAEEHGEEPEPEMPVLKRSRSKAKAQASVDNEDPPAAARSKRKRPISPVPEEDETTPTKKVKTLPLQDVDEQSPPSMRKGAKGRKPPSKTKPASKGDSRRLKENTPMSDCSEGRPAKHTRVRFRLAVFPLDDLLTSQPQSHSKPPSKITGPRKSVRARMLEPLPPLEDNDPDPIDFLS